MIKVKLPPKLELLVKLHYNQIIIIIIPLFFQFNMSAYCLFIYNLRYLKIIKSKNAFQENSN